MLRCQIGQSFVQYNVGLKQNRKTLKNVDDILLNILYFSYDFIHTSNPKFKKACPVSRPKNQGLLIYSQNIQSLTNTGLQNQKLSGQGSGRRPGTEIKWDSDQ